MPGPMFFNARAQPLAQFFRALRYVREPLKERAQIQSRADGEYRQAFASPEVFQNAQSPLAVAPRGDVILWAKHVNQMVRNAAAFGGARLCGANIKTTIELRRITGYNFPAESLRKLHAERRLSRCRTTNNNNERQKRFDVTHRKRRCRARTESKISTRSGRSRLPRTTWRGCFTGAPLH